MLSAMLTLVGSVGILSVLVWALGAGGSIAVSSSQLRLAQSVPAEISTLQVAASSCSTTNPSGDNGSGGPFAGWAGSGGEWVAVATLVCPGGGPIWVGTLFAPRLWEYRLNASGAQVRLACAACTTALAGKVGGTLANGVLTVPLAVAP